MTQFATITNTKDWAYRSALIYLQAFFETMLRFPAAFVIFWTLLVISSVKLPSFFFFFFFFKLMSCVLSLPLSNIALATCQQQHCWQSCYYFNFADYSFYCSTLAVSMFYFSRDIGDIFMSVSFFSLSLTALLSRGVAKFPCWQSSPWRVFRILVLSHLSYNNWNHPMYRKERKDNKNA